MSRSTLEVADLVRTSGNRFWEHHGSRHAWQHRKVLDAIVRCPTVALGLIVISAPAAVIRLSLTTHAVTGTAQDVRGTPAPGGWPSPGLSCLPLSYFHLVFTLPLELSALALQNKRLLYDLLFQASAATLLELAGDPKAKQLNLM